MSEVQIAIIDQQETQIALAVPGVQGPPGADGTGFTIQGTVPTEADLQAIVSPATGDAYQVVATKDIHVWRESWINLGPIEGPPGPAGPAGADGADGADGASAYQVAVAAGFVGTETQWLASLTGPQGPPGADGVDGAPGADGSDGSPGASAYQVAVANGFAGTEAQWLTSLVGPAGADGVDGSPGADGADGASAYEIAVAAGFVGTESQWLASLVGPAGADGVDGVDGADGAGLALQGTVPTVGDLPSTSTVGYGYIVEATGDLHVWNGTGWVNAGPIQGPAGPAGPAGPTGATGPAGPTGPQGPAGADGSPGADGADGAPGSDGASAYQLAVAGGFSGTEAQWLASLVGPQGPAGPAGADGLDGGPGADGADGSSAYELAVAGGFVGSEAAWLASLVGPQGPTGPAGPQGDQGPAGATGPAGPQGPAGPTGATGPQGPAGVGVPAGGTTGQYLRKTSGTDYDADWGDFPATDLSYNSATRQLASSTGADATLPLFSSTEPGLTPQSGGGTTNFLRADGTWAAPAGGGGGTAIDPGYYDFSPVFGTGSFIAPFNAAASLINTTAAVGAVGFNPIYIPQTTTFTQILCRTGTSYAGTSEVYLGVYDHDATLNRPNAKIYDSGLLQITASGAANYGPGPISLTLDPGFYWLAFLAVTVGATPQFAGTDATALRGVGFPWYQEFDVNGARVWAIRVQSTGGLPAGPNIPNMGRVVFGHPLTFLGVDK